MKTVASRGFTIIETVLFLGVTGLMIVGVLFGVGNSIGVQRYKDSVESFKSFLQQQYAELSSVQNPREGEWVCRVSGSNLSVQSEPSGSFQSRPRGQADCAIIGRYVTISGSDINVRTVLAHKSGTPTGATDIDKLASSAYIMGVSSADANQSTIEWGARLAWPTGDTTVDPRPTSLGNEDRAIALLFIRSPDGGNVYTFSDNTIPYEQPSNEQLKALLVGSDSVPGRAERLLCLDSDGMVLTGNTGVFIASRAAESSAIRVATDADFSRGQSC